MSATKFSTDIVPLGDLKMNPGKVVRHAGETRRPVLLTSHGRGVAVLQTLSGFEGETEEREFLRGVVRGLMDLEEHRELSLPEIRRRLGLT
jgi:prevent-host-death family protein